MAADFKEVPYIKLAPSAKRKALEILGAGNVLLKKWAAFFPPKKFRQFRNNVMQGDKNPVINTDQKHCIPADKLGEYHDDLPYMTAIRHSVYEELGGRSAEQAILEGHAAMAKQHARKWSIEGDPVGITKADFLQEAYMQVIEAIYSWLPEHNVDIGTYIFTALKNRMSNVTNQQGHMLCPLTNTDLKLVSLYEKTRREMSEHVTFDQVVIKLGLSSDEGNHLNSLLTRVYTENQFAAGGENAADSEAEVDGNDYTGHRAGIDKESETEISIQQQHVNDTLTRANLSKLERLVIEAAMEPYHGWQIEFARTHINAETGKPYSRMRITQVLESAQKKLAAYVQRRAA